jgi:hypothetical protein
MNIRILRSARRTVAAGIHFYDGQQSGLGAYFLSSIMSDIRSLGIYAGVHPKHYNSYYRMVCTKFPYSVYYRIDGSYVDIYAVLDDRQDPEVIRNVLATKDTEA